MTRDLDQELGSVQSRVVDSLHLMTCLFGFLAVCTGLARGWFVLHDLRSMIPSSVAVTLAIASYLWRRRISWELRSWVILAGMMASAIIALWNFGIAAPAGILAAVSAMVGWLIWPRRRAIVLSLLALGGVLSVAAKNVLHGSSLEGLLPEYNRSILFWANLVVVHITISVMMLAVVLSLLRSWRNAADQARDRERESLADKDRLAGILQGIHDAVFIHDPVDGRVLELHGRVEGMYGFTPERILAEGLGIVSASYPPWTIVEAWGWISLAKTQGPQTFPWRARRANGSHFWVEVSIRMVKLRGLDRVLVTVRDIDESMRVHQELVQLNATLEQRVRDRTAEIERSWAASEAFAYTVSHDLRAPLRAIDGYARALREDHLAQLDSTAAGYVDRIASRADRMGRLIDALLGLGKMGRHPVRLEAVPLEQLVREVVEEVRGPQLVESGSPSQTQWQVETLPIVQTDRELARQVFVNLLANAHKFSSRRETPVVAVRSIARSGEAWFEVADNGEGFDSNQVSDLFQPFHRLHGEAFEGVGIGLATVKTILDLLGGEMEVEAEKGKGATFRFRLGPSSPSQPERGADPPEP